MTPQFSLLSAESICRPLENDIKITPITPIKHTTLPKKVDYVHYGNYYRTYKDFTNYQLRYQQALNDGTAGCMINLQISHKHDILDKIVSGLVKDPDSYKLNYKNHVRLYRYLDGFGQSSAYRHYLDGCDVTVKSFMGDVDDFGHPLPELSDISEVVDRCMQRGNVHECPNGHYVYKPTNACKQHKYCVICASNYSRRKALGIMDLLFTMSMKLPDLAVTDIVFTLPEDIQSMLTYDNINKFSGVISKTVKRYHSEVISVKKSLNGRVRTRDKRIYHKPGGFSVIHTWHSTDPTKGWYPHGHTAWVNYVIDGVTGQPKKVDSYYDEAKLKQIYSEELVKAFNVPVDNINLNLSYLSVNRANEPKLMHNFNYICREPVIDVVDHAKNQRWDSKERHYYPRRGGGAVISAFTPKQLESIGLIVNYPKYHKRLRWFGFLSDSVKFMQLAKMGITRDEINIDYDLMDKESPVICPVCHAECSPLMDVLTMPEAKDRYKNNLFYELRPLSECSFDTRQYVYRLMQDLWAYEKEYYQMMSEDIKAEVGCIPDLPEECFNDKTEHELAEYDEVSQ